MGVWIETFYFQKKTINPEVTPCVGVWIETGIALYALSITSVTPCVGVWIETRINQLTGERDKCHTLRGCVD